MIKEVEVEKVVEVERVVEVPVEREVVREIVREVPVDRVVEVEKLVGMREEEVEAMKQALQVQAEQERQRLLDTNLLSAEENARQHAMLMEQQERIGNEQAEAERAKAELAALEAKIMHGGEHVRDRVTRQQQEIEAREREIVKQQEAERQAMQVGRAATATTTPSTASTATTSTSTATSTPATSTPCRSTAGRRRSAWRWRSGIRPLRRRRRRWARN